jgi:O-antigen/teichoic acid export membrane protein
MLRAIGRNVLSNWIGLGVTMVVAFFMSPFLVHTLGDAQYGIWVLVLSVTGYMGLMDGGLKVSVVKFVAGHRATGDRDALGETVSTALALYGIVAVFLLGAAAVIGLFLDALFRIPPDLHETARLVLMITGSTLSITLVSSVFGGFLAGHQRYDLINGVGISLALLSAATIYLVVSRGYGIVGLGLVQFGSQVVSGLLLYAMTRRLRPDLRLGIGQVRFDRARQLYGYSLFVLLNSVAMLLLFRSGELVTGVLLGTAAVTYFAIGGMLVEYLGKLIGQMTQVLHPMASGQHATGDHAGLRTAVIASTRACIAIALPACVGFVILGKSFISAWMGPAYAEIAGPVLIVLSVARLFWLAQSGAANILLGAGGHRELTLLTASTGISGIALAALLARGYGIIGVAGGLALAIVAIYGLVMPVFVCRRMGIGAAEYLRGAVSGPVVATLPFAAALLLAARWIEPASVGGIASVVALAAPVYLATAWYSCLDRAQRTRIEELLVQRRGR